LNELAAVPEDAAAAPTPAGEITILPTAPVGFVHWDETRAMMNVLKTGLPRGAKEVARAGGR